MGLFGRSTPVPEPVLPIPRETRTWPKAMPAVKAAPPPPPAVLAKPAAPVSAPAPAAVVKAPAPPPAKTVPAPTIVKPTPPRVAAPEGKPAEPPPAAAAREASSVVAAFANWKQATAAKTAVAGKTETAPSDVPPPKREDPVLYVYRAAAKQARGDHDAAIEDLSKAIEIDPTCTTAWAGRALSLEAKGDLAGARRDYAKSIEIELRQEIARLARPL
ncbi:MAG TPA: hypothetical protein VF950_00575 [Planctomycetota bacterium]